MFVPRDRLLWDAISVAGVVHGWYAKTRGWVLSPVLPAAQLLFAIISEDIPRPSRPTSYALIPVDHTPHISFPRRPEACLGHYHAVRPSLLLLLPLLLREGLLS